MEVSGEGSRFGSTRSKYDHGTGMACLDRPVGDSCDTGSVIKRVLVLGACLCFLALETILSGPFLPAPSETSAHRYVPVPPAGEKACDIMAMATSVESLLQQGLGPGHALPPSIPPR